MEQIVVFDVGYEYCNKTQLEIPIKLCFEQSLTLNHYVHIIIGKINTITKVFSTCFLTEYFKEIPLVIIFNTDKTIYFPLSYHFIQDVLINTTFQNHFIKAISNQFKMNYIFSKEKGLIFKLNNIFTLDKFHEFDINSFYSKNHQKMINYITVFYTKRFNEFPLNYIISNERTNIFSIDFAIGIIHILNPDITAYFENNIMQNILFNPHYGQFRKLILNSESAFTE